MFAHQRILSTLTSLLISLFICSCAVDAPSSSHSNTVSSSKSLDENLYQWINTYRAKDQRASLIRKKNLDKLALDHANMLANDSTVEYDHARHSILLKGSRILHSEVTPLFYQGQIQSGSEPAMSIVKSWSQIGHQKAALTRKWKNIGIASVKKNSGESVIVVIVANPYPRGRNYLSNPGWQQHYGNF